MTSKTHPAIAVCILAGGLSSRMGRDKAALRVGRHSMLTRIRTTAKQLGWPVRVIRRDLVPRCGPLGGIYTAFRRTRAETILFLACDMPFVTAELLRELLRRLGRGTAVFTRNDGRCGFPFALRRQTLPVIEAQIESGQFSLRALAHRLKAKFHCPTRVTSDLFNVNTPEDWETARAASRRGRIRAVGAGRQTR